MVVRKVSGAVCAGLWVVAGAALAPHVAAASEPARIHYFEPLHVLPAASGNGERKAGASLQQLRFDAFGRRFDISLGSNGRLMANKPEQSQLELYRGSIDGIAGSWVRLATKGAAVHGMMWDGSQLYAIEPAAEVRDALDPSSQVDAAQTIVFRLADVTVDSGTTACATESSPAKASDAFAALSNELKSTSVMMQAAGATRRLDVSALGDARFRARYGNEQDAREAILTRLNNVDGIFSSQLAIEIRVASLSVPDAANDPLSSATMPNTLLRELAELRRRTPEMRSQGLTHLFTDRDLDGSTIGIAYLDSLCDNRNAVGLTESRNTWLDSLVAAHEIGHNFGADHDGDAQGSCPSAPSSGFLMAPVVSGTDDFSACSLNRMRSRANSASCITNLPPANVRLPSQLGTVRRPLSAQFQYQLPITNAGGLSARNVHAELTLPPTLTIVDAGVVGGSCLSGGGTVQCELGDIAGGNVRTIELELNSDIAAANTIAARITADNDGNRSDNDASGTIVIESRRDVSVALRGPASAAANQTFTVGFDVTNAASDNAGTVTVQIEVPDSIAINNASMAGGNCTTSDTGIECTLTSLSGGATASGSLSLRASSEGNATVHVAVSGDYFDTNNSNDTRTLVVAIGPSAALATDQSDSPGNSGRGGGGSAGLLLLLALAPLGFARRRRA
jgi:hypothetical protein